MGASRNGKEKLANKSKLIEAFPILYFFPAVLTLLSPHCRLQNRVSEDGSVSANIFA